MALSDWALQQAIYTRLTNQLGGTPVYDHVPQDSSYPYVTIGETMLSGWDSKSFDGQEATVTIQVWDQAAGRKSVKEIMAEIYDALHNQESNINPTGFTVIFCKHDFTESFYDAEGQEKYYRGIMRFRLLVQTLEEMLLESGSRLLLESGGILLLEAS